MTYNDLILYRIIAPAGRLSELTKDKEVQEVMMEAARTMFQNQDINVDPTRAVMSEYDDELSVSSVLIKCNLLLRNTMNVFFLKVSFSSP